MSASVSTSITASGQSATLRSLLIKLIRTLAVIMFAVVPVAMVLFTVVLAHGGTNYFYDFVGDIYKAGRAILHGHDPYQAAFLAHLAAVERSGGSPTQSFAVPVYPAPVLVATAPLALLGGRTAGLMFTLISIAAMVGGLRLLGVRDWRCYGAAFLSFPLLHSLRLGQVNELLVFGIAVLWRWRARLWPPAIATATIVLAKVFLWPLAVWLVLTRRWRAAVLAATIALVATVAAWAVIGFGSLSEYPRMLGNLSTVEGPAGVSAISVGRALGVSTSLSQLVALLLAAVLLAVALRLFYASDDPNAERRSFGLAVMAALVASPVVWPHYLTLVFVPIALLSPNLSALWLVPMLAYLAPAELTGGDISKMLPYVAIEMIVIACLFSKRLPDALRNRPSSPDTTSLPDFSAASGGPAERVIPTGRLRDGLRTTPFRSHNAAQRPTTGP